MRSTASSTYHISTCFLDLLAFQSLLDVAQNIMSATYKGVVGWVDGVGWMGGWWAKVILQTQWYQLLCQMTLPWSSNHTTRQSRPPDNNHGQLGAASHQCHFIKARQALLKCF